MSRTTKLFIAGAAAVALRVLDDSFIQPPAGTSAADHLVSGLTPLALLTVAALAFPRLGPIGRGLLAILTGFAGVVTGADAFYYAAETGLGSEDLSGFLAAAAGLGLVWLGGSILWRGRRLDQGRGQRYGMRALVAVSALFFATTVAFPVAVGYLTTHIQGQDVPEANLNAPHREVELVTADGLALDGWYVPSKNGAAVVVFPGRRESTQGRARMLIEHGYGVILLDRRGEGASEGAPNAFGWGGDRDVAAAVDFLRSQPEVDDDRVAGIGLSVGGEMMLDLASKPDDGLAAVISEGAGTRSWAEEKETPDGGISGVVPLLAKTASVAVFSDTAPPPSMFEVIPEVAPTPLFLISSEDAKNEVLAPRFAEVAGPAAETWAIPGDDHIGGIDVAPKEYERRVIGFLEGALNHG